MPCIPVGGAIVCVASDNFLRRRLMQCPTCKRRRRFVVRFEAWYGPTAYCLGCGDSWQDGERSPRPFKRAWRRAAKDYHRELWAKAKSGRGPTYEELYGDYEEVPA